VGFGLKNYLKKITKRLRTNFNSCDGYSEKCLLITALAYARTNSNLDKIKDLSAVEFSVYSQWGEDGIIDWLVSRIPSIPKTFVEFGVENYREANTRFLLNPKNWSGLVLDGSPSNILDIRSQDIYWRHSFNAQTAFIDSNNINNIINDAGISGDIGLLSIDIDGNDYWVWEAIVAVSPAIVVIEYNAVFGDIHNITIPYHPDFDRTAGHYSNLYFGASISALIELGKEKGYRFIGTTSTGVNAFFVREDLAQYVFNAISEISIYPSMIREARAKDGTLLYVDGEARARLIGTMPVLNVKSGETTSLTDFETLYSDAWTKSIKRIL